MTQHYTQEYFNNVRTRMTCQNPNGYLSDTTGKCAGIIINYLYHISQPGHLSNIEYLACETNISQA